MPIILEIKVVPQSGYSRILLDKSGKIVVQVKSAAEDGKANRELIKLFAHHLDLTQSDITIVSGLTSRKKRIKINTLLTRELVMHNLGLDINLKICN